MDFEPTPEQAMLADSVDRLVQRTLARPRGDVPDTVALWRRFAELGWLGIGIPEDEGGVGGGAIETMMVAQGIGRGLLAVPHLSSVVLGAGLLRRLGTAEQRRRWLPGVAAGDVRLAVAIAEPGRRGDPLAFGTTAIGTAAGIVLSGRKSLVLDAEGADLILVAARRDNGASGVFLVERGVACATLGPCRTADGRPAADLLLDDVTLDRSTLLGDGADATPALAATIDHALAALAAEAVGAMEECVHLTGAYLGTRRQFGAPLASFQVLRHRYADMQIELEHARSLATVAAMALAEGADEAHRLAAMAKACIGQAGRFIGESCIQLHGGMGMTADYAAGAYYKRLIMTDLLLGNRDAQLRRLAASYGDQAADRGEGHPC